MPDPKVIIGIAPFEGGYTVFDQLGREHVVTDPKAVWSLLAELCGETDLPKTELVSPLGEKFKAAAVKIGSRFVPPEYHEAVEPLVEVLGRAGNGIAEWVRRPKAVVAKPPRAERARPEPRVEPDPEPRPATFKPRGPRPNGVPRRRLPAPGGQG